MSLFVMNFPLINVQAESLKIKNSVLIDAPLIRQNPELPRGCEVTSLAMLLQHAGIKFDKMTLADLIKKDPTPYKKKNGKIYYGNPYNGFVGDMYIKKNRGLGVYHEPIADLSRTFLPTRTINFTGHSFEDVQRYLTNGTPVWVITNARYKELPKSKFETWHTRDGIIRITYHEHSVLITGYDQKYVYFNDPLTGVKNKKAPKQDFIKAWEQMGKQAITYLND